MKKYLLLLLFSTLPFMLTAQSGSIALIEYIEGDPSEVLVTHLSGEVEEGYIGMEVDLESNIETGLASVEVRLEPNGTILNIDQNTVFELTAIQGRANSSETVFTLIAGRLRTVAARAGITNKYTVRTPDAVCGIRGTEILNSVTPGEGSSIICKTGSVEVINTDPEFNNNRVLIGANQMVNTGNPVFVSEIVPPAMMAETFDSLPFRRLDPESVPSSDEPSLTDDEGQTEEGEEQVTEDEDQSTEDNLQAEDDSALTQDEGDSTVEVEDTTDSLATDTEDEESSSDGDDNSDRTAVGEITGPQLTTDIDDGTESDDNEENDREPSALEEWFSNNMGFEVGAVNINGETYAKVIAQPVIRTDKLTLGLYLPIIYSENMLDPNDWYKPEGNNEWSFGSEEFKNKEWIDGILDFGDDLMLKIRFLEYGDPLWDPFYLKLGNLTSMTLGHGTLVKGYSNNINFPSIRKLGFNSGATFGNFGIEFLVDDMSSFESISIIGGRFRYGTEKGFGVALTGITDLHMAGEMADPTLWGDPVNIGASLDFDLFKIDAGIVKMLVYMDLAAVTPYFRNQPDGTTFNYQNPFGLFWSDSKIHNVGAVAGLKSELLMLDFTLDLRYENGLYHHNMFNNLYDRYRMNYLNDMVNYLEAQSTGTLAEGENRIAVYGEGGFSLMDQKIRMMLAYEWPWEIVGNSINVSDEDYLKIGLELEKGLIPVYDVSGAIYYERIGFYQAILDDDLQLFDTSTVLSGELVLPLAPTLDLAMVASSSTLYNEDGSLQTLPDGVTPKIVPVFNIETRIHF